MGLVVIVRFGFKICLTLVYICLIVFNIHINFVPAMKKITQHIAAYKARTSGEGQVFFAVGLCLETNLRLQEK